MVMDAVETTNQPSISHVTTNISYGEIIGTSELDMRQNFEEILSACSKQTCHHKEYSLASLIELTFSCKFQACIRTRSIENNFHLNAGHLSLRVQLVGWSLELEVIACSCLFFVSPKAQLQWDTYFCFSLRSVKSAFYSNISVPPFETFGGKSLLLSFIHFRVETTHCCVLSVGEASTFLWGFEPLNGDFSFVQYMKICGIELFLTNFYHS